MPFRAVRPLHVYCPKGSWSHVWVSGSRVKISPRSLGLCQATTGKGTLRYCCSCLTVTSINITPFTLCIFDVINLLNFIQAIELLNVVSDFHFGAYEDKPIFTIIDMQNDGYSLNVKAHLVSEDYRIYLRKVAESYKLVIQESDGFLTIQG